jgi:hypothetical protein
MCEYRRRTGTGQPDVEGLGTTHRNLGSVRRFTASFEHPLSQLLCQRVSRPAQEAAVRGDAVSEHQLGRRGHTKAVRLGEPHRAHRGIRASPACECHAEVLKSSHAIHVALKRVEPPTR